MKLKITSVLTVLVLVTCSAFAQLSGIYTIGGSSPDYATITDAKNDLLSQGVSGPVVFNIRDGIYNEQVLFTAIANTSSTNTVTFQSENSDSSLVIWEYPSNALLNPNYTVGFSGCSYINLSELTIRRTGTNNSARVVEFGGATSDISISNCVLTNEIVSGTLASACIVGSNSGTVDNNNSFSHNLISGGTFGIYWYGGSTTIQFETGNTFLNNSIQNSTTRNVFFNYQANVTFSGNEMSTNSVSASFYGLAASGCNTLIFTGNKINCPAGGYGIYLQGCNAVAGSEGLIANNFITVGGSATSYGINLNTCAYQDIFYNSVNVTGSNVNTGRAFLIQNTATNHIRVLNNNFINTGTGYAVYFEGVTNLVVSMMNYNNLFTTGITLGYYNGNRPNLAAWKSGSFLDTNSVSFDPQFISATDLHMPPVVVNDFGTPVASITTDIDGEVRNAFSPDIGADEYSAFAQDVSMRAILTPVNFECVEDSIYITAIVKNAGSDNLTNFDIYVDVTGTVTSSQVYNYTDTLLAGQLDTITFLNPINTQTGAILNIVAYTGLATDMYLANDTVSKSVTLYSIPADPVMQAPVPQPACSNQPVTIDGTVGPDEDIVFYDVAVGGNPIHVGHPWVTTFSSSTTVYAEARDTSYSLSISDSLSTTNAGGNGSSAMFFDVTNISQSPVTIHYLSTLIAGTQTATVYYLPGGLTSCTVNPVIGNFTMVGSATVNGLGGAGFPFTFIPVDLNVTIPPGQKYAFCISSPSLTYTNGTGTGTCPDIASNTAISIHEGFGGTTTGPIANRRLNGTVSYTIGGGGCPSNRIPVAINILSASVNLGPDTAIAFPNTVVLDAGIAVSYLWSNGETTQTIVVGNSGTYTVIITDANGCTATDEIVVTVLTGINDLNDDIVSVHPNPVNNLLFVEFNHVNNGDEITLTLFDNTGREVLAKKLNTASDFVSTQLNLESLSKGVYLLQIRNNHSVLNQSIVKY